MIKEKALSKINFEADQQEIVEKTDIQTLSRYCLMLQNLEDQMVNMEKDLKKLKEEADKISSEVIPNLLAEQGLSSLKLADGSSVDIRKSYNCTIKKDQMELAYNWLRENGLGDIIKNEVAVQFGKGEDNKAEQLLGLAVREGYEPSQKQKVEPMTLKALFRERVEAGLDMPSQFFHTFFDNMGSEDFALPFLRVLGQLSPETNKRDAKYVDGAEPGMIFNTVTKKLYDGEKGLNVVPCYYKREYVEWSDRGEGTSAPVKIHSVQSGIIEQATRDASYKDRLPNGNYLENTASYFVLLESGEAALISMKSTQLKVSRSWNSMMNSIKMKGGKGMYTPPMYSHVYNLKTVQQSNDKGTWFGWSVEKVGEITDVSLYEQAKGFADSAVKGEVITKHGEESANSDKESVPF